MQKQGFYFFFLFLGFVFSTSYGQIGNVIGNNGNNKKQAPKALAPFSTEALAYKITQNYNSDSQKATAIYKWIATNISYDNELRQNLRLQKEFYTSEEKVIRKVLERQMALCGGFAFLFKKLCADVGITAEVVHGFTKDYTGKSKDYKKPEHTWNAVKLNNKWQLLDITWAISHGSGNKPDDFWFLTKPSDFIYTHYPLDPKWTLQKEPISITEFRK